MLVEEMVLNVLRLMILFGIIRYYVCYFLDWFKIIYFDEKILNI